MPSCVALIPARGGSKRVKGKNIRKLAGEPLIAYTISAAMDSGVFGKVLVSSDDPGILNTARIYGADVIKRPEEYATDVSPDIEWVRHAIEKLDRQGDRFDCFSILRPTSPFRKPETIKRAWEQWCGQSPIRPYSSLRAIEKCSQHPAKMWEVRGGQLVPLLLQPAHPFHDSQYASLPEVYVQNASLEIAWCETARQGSISGTSIMPFFTQDDEGLDVNTELDWELAERKIERKSATLPTVTPRAPALEEIHA